MSFNKFITHNRFSCVKPVHAAMSASRGRHRSVCCGAGHLRLRLRLSLRPLCLRPLCPPRPLTRAWAGRSCSACGDSSGYAGCSRHTRACVWGHREFLDAPWRKNSFDGTSCNSGHGGLMFIMLYPCCLGSRLLVILSQICCVSYLSSERA